MTKENNYVGWGPIPSRILAQVCYTNKLLVFRNSGSILRERRKFRLQEASSLALQLFAAVLLSWVALNLFADFGPMKYGSSHGIRHSHSDWALQGTNLVNNCLMIVLICGLSLIKFSLFLAVLKKKFRKLGPGFYALVLFVLAISAIWVFLQLRTGVSKYDLFVPSSLVFNVSLVFLSSIFFPGVDSFRTIKFTKLNP